LPRERRVPRDRCLPDFRRRQRFGLEIARWMVAAVREIWSCSAAADAKSIAMERPSRHEAIGRRRCRGSSDVTIQPPWDRYLHSSSGDMPPLVE